MRDISVLLRPSNQFHGINAFQKLDVIDAGDVPAIPGNIDETYRRITERFGALQAQGTVPIGIGGYAMAPKLALALPFIFIVGVTSLVIDALVLTAVQAGVHATVRGRAAGLWVLMIGLQPIGVLEVGLVAQLAGARWAQGINSSIVIVFGMAMLFTALGRRISDMETVSSSAS